MLSGFNNNKNNHLQGIDITADDAKKNVRNAVPPTKCNERLRACIIAIDKSSKGGCQEHDELNVPRDEAIYLVKELKRRDFNVKLVELHNDQDEFHVNISWY